MTVRRTILAASILAALLMPGCNERFDDSASPLWFTVTSITPSSTPFGDVYDSSTNSFHPDTVDVGLEAHFADQNEPPSGSAYTTIQVDRYRVSFSRTDGGVEVPAGFEQSLSVQVEAEGAEVLISGLVILRADQKLQPPLVYLTPLSYGFEPSTGYTTIACNCLVEFFGHTLDGEQVYAAGGVGINFADYVN
jgi:hypothetical protein